MQKHCICQQVSMQKHCIWFSTCSESVIISCLHWQQILDTRQDGFLRGWPCPTNLLNVMKMISRTIAVSFGVYICFLDFKWALYEANNKIFHNKRTVQEAFYRLVTRMNIVTTLLAMPCVSKLKLSYVLIVSRAMAAVKCMAVPC